MFYCWAIWSSVRSSVPNEFDQQLFNVLRNTSGVYQDFAHVSIWKLFWTSRYIYFSYRSKELVTISFDGVCNIFIVSSRSSDFFFPSVGRLINFLSNPHETLLCLIQILWLGNDSDFASASSLEFIYFFHKMCEWLWWLSTGRCWAIYSKIFCYIFFHHRKGQWNWDWGDPMTWCWRLDVMKTTTGLEHLTRNCRQRRNAVRTASKYDRHPCAFIAPHSKLKSFYDLTPFWPLRLIRRRRWNVPTTTTVWIKCQIGQIPNSRMRRECG